MSKVAEKIAAELGSAGVMPFKRFMELALYCPVYGYYEAEGDTIGRGGDFYTSVSVGPMFGQLLGWQFSQWLGECGVGSAECGMGRQQPALVEAGGHRGELAADILRWLRQWRPEVWEQIHYYLVEPSPRRREWQQKTLAEFGDKVRWVGGLGELAVKPQSLTGIIFSNELLDAFPVQRFGWDSREQTWFEWGVGLENGNFVWRRLDGQPAVLGYELPPELLAVLPDGFTLEVCPGAEQWWSEAAHVLGCGKLLTFDYGLTAEEFLMPERRDGTLRAYHRHQLSTDLLSHPGEQDLTAHVNFSAIQRAGEAAGLRTEAFTSQGQFLTSIAAQLWQEPSEASQWSAEQRRQFQTLIHPQHLGQAFKVLLQAR